MKSSLRIWTILMMIGVLSMVSCGLTPDQIGVIIKPGTVNLFQKTNPEKLLEAVRNIGTARAIDETLLNYKEMERKDPMWPVYVFLTGEIFRLRGENSAARQAYQSLVEWASTDPYSDTWGGSGLVPVALWRWVRLLCIDKQPDPAEVSLLFRFSDRMKETRLTRMMFDNPGFVISTLPQLEEDILRYMAKAAYLAEEKNMAMQSFLKYLSIAGDPELNEVEQEIWNQLISQGMASEDRLNLLRGERMLQIKRFPEAENFLGKAVKSGDLQVRAEAGYHLAYIRKFKAFNRNEILNRLDTVLEDAADPDLIQKTLFLKAEVYNYSGKGRNKQAFIDALLKLAELFPRGDLADESIYRIALLFQDEGDTDKALEYFEKLRNIFFNNQLF